MDELDILKQDWQKQDSNYPKLSYDDIYKMILKRSSSIVKWIFIISILEFVFWTAISFALKDSDVNKKFESYNAQNIMIPFIVIGYAVLAYFFYRFFMNYRTISVTDNAKRLMENILRTRRTVRYYVAFNLIYLVVTAFLVLGIEFKRDPVMVATIKEATANGEILKFYAVTILTTTVVLAVCIGLFLLFYYLIYGLLLKRLNSNYDELKKMDVK